MCGMIRHRCHVNRLRRVWVLSRLGWQWVALWDNGRAETRRYQSSQWWSAILQTTRDAALVLGVPQEVDIMLKKNWKTSLAGVSTILAIVAKIAATGQVDWQTDGPAILTAIGLLVAKDAAPKE